jgi:serine/threonine-protein kinase
MASRVNGSSQLEEECHMMPSQRESFDRELTARVFHDPLIGQTLSHYDIIGKLGAGAMGMVYSARDRKLGRCVALKFLFPHLSHDETARKRLVHEARVASAADHRHICTIHTLEETDDGQLFIVMAHYDGKTLKQCLEDGPLPLDLAIEVAQNCADGLARAHHHGVVHRDIKPANLLITDDGVKILDFGIACVAGSEESQSSAGYVVGTIDYMSPEQARGKPADARSDIWGIGAVFFEALTGEPPFKRSHHEATLYAINHEPVRPTPAWQAIPERVRLIVLRALEKDPGRRYQTARELAIDLERCTLTLGHRVPTQTQ